MASGSGNGSSNQPPEGYSPPRRTPTDSSYYSFNGVPFDNQDQSSATWIYAREARQQQAGVPTSQSRPYPSRFGNGENLPLTTPGSQLKPGRQKEWLHHPLTPNRSATWTKDNGDSVGGVRSFYTDGNPRKFDVGYHDPRVGTSEKGHGSFALANYHKAVPKPPRRAPTT